MKISAIIVAGAQACLNQESLAMSHGPCGDRNPQSCDFEEWLEKNLWESAVESFNFASNNWEEFTNQAKSVSRTNHFLKVKK